jgi:hypothetical protein
MFSIALSYCNSTFLSKLDDKKIQKKRKQERNKVSHTSASA